MEKDVFSANSKVAKSDIQLEICEHSSPSYGPRTWVNARSADATIAFAADFSTAGERTTHKAAGNSYIGIGFGRHNLNQEGALQAARQLYAFLRSKPGPKLNIAGNGIYVLKRFELDQDNANVFVTSVLAKVHSHHPIRHICSGGQTGLDTAGAVAAVFLGIPARLLMPQGFIQRDAKRVDGPRDPKALHEQIVQAAAELRGRLLC